VNASHHAVAMSFSFVLLRIIAPEHVRNCGQDARWTNCATGRNAMQITRRNVLISGAAGAATALMPKVTFGGWEPSERYPDPAIKILDPSFTKYRVATASVERLATGMRWSEGPVWFGDARCLLWSDLPNNRIMRWDEETGRTTIFRKPSNYANGNTRDRQGRLITCEHDTRRVTRTEYDGTITVLIDKFDGKPFNSPNDVVVKSDDSIWFSDPPFGLDNYIGHVAQSELPTNVYRLDQKSGRASVVIDDVFPNGLCFSPDEKKMYSVDYKMRGIRAYDVVDDGTKLANGRLLVNSPPPQTPDGFRCDVDGNLWCGWAGGEGIDGVMIYNPSGQPIGRIDLPERCANVCFGGVKRNRLFMTASHSLYSLYVGAQGAIGG
jgi:gluconolactonase